MAEETIHLPVTPETTQPDGGNSRRNSMGEADSSKSGEKVIPRYLRASMGSCHDFCKYGKKNASEEKAKIPIRKRITRKPCDKTPAANSVESLDSPQEKKKSVIKLKPSPNSRIHTPDASDVIKRELPIKSSQSKSPGEHEVLSENKISAVKLMHSPNSKSRISDTAKSMSHEELSPSVKVRAPSRKASSKAKEMSISSKSATSLKLKGTLPSSPSASGGSSGRRVSGISDIKMRKSTLASKVAVKKLLASPRTSLSPKAANENVSITSRNQRSLNVVYPLKNQNKVKKAEPGQRRKGLTESNSSPDELKESNGDALPEKTLYVIKMETEKTILESDKYQNCAVELSPPLSSPKSSSLLVSPYSSSHGTGDQEECEYAVSETEDYSTSEYDENVDAEEMETLEGENKGRARKTGIDCSEDKDCQPSKLHFRKGKVVDIQGGNNNPRRLKFRRGRVLGESRNRKSEGHKSFKERIDAGTDDKEPSGEKVVLRHQDLQGKKDAQGLLNVVIEETASKLVETRKSKVKALVGAFETVISLHESKPSANS